MGTIKTGSQSKSMIAKMASKYIDQKKNAFYLLNKNAIDLIDGRIVDLMERIDLEASPDRVKRIIRLWGEFKAAFPGLRSYFASSPDADRAYSSLNAEMEAAYHDYNGWTQIFNALELRRKHTESEIKILKDLKVLMTAEDGMELAAQLFAAVVETLRNEPKGQSYIQLIRLKFERLTGAGDFEPDEAGGTEIIDLDTF